jgi:hypothetical protein
VDSQILDYSSIMSLVGARPVPLACHTNVLMLPFLFGAFELALAAVLGRVVDYAFYVAYEP